MATKKAKTHYKCSECGATSVKWQGRCTTCQAYNTMEEFIPNDISPSSIKNRLSTGGYSNLNNEICRLSEVQNHMLETTHTNITSLDNILSSDKGLVRGSITLLGGDPGIGKSTLLLQLAGIFATHPNRDIKVLYISGEESASQIAMRGKRLGLEEGGALDKIYIANMAELESIIAILNNEEYKPDFMIIDSIQTIYSAQLQSTPGSVSQIKECASVIARFAKTHNIDTFLIGHVTKDGDIAGPQVLEHIVDTILYFEGTSGNDALSLNYRTLRVHKNRYGSTNEVALFEMVENGLVEIKDPSAIFLDDRDEGDLVGTAFLATQYQNQAMMIEIQSLVDANNGATQYPKRVANGVEYNRLSILLALLNKMSGCKLYNYDIFVNVASGFNIIDTASDLAVLLSILSSIQEIPIRPYTAVFGEISLNGKLRMCSNIEQRIAVAAKTGFKHIICPVIKDKKLINKIHKNYSDIKLHMCKDILEAIELVFVKK